MKQKTMVKNGKRVPISEKGINRKAKAKTKTRPPKPAEADTRRKDKERIAKLVWKATEASRTTIGKLTALVDTWDEYDQKAEGLKDAIGGLKGQIAEHKAEIRTAAAEAKDKTGEDAEKALRKLAGLERDVERWEVTLEGKKEERAGAREAMKVAMADIRKIIKEGPGLFEDSASPTTKPAASPTEPKSSTSASGKPCGVDADGKPLRVGGIYILTTEQGVIRGSKTTPGGHPAKIERIMDSGRCVIADHPEGNHRCEINPDNFIWKEWSPTAPGERKSVQGRPSASATTPASASEKPASTAPPGATATPPDAPKNADEDRLAKIPVAEVMANIQDAHAALAKLEKHRIKTLRDAAAKGRVFLVNDVGLTITEAQVLVDAMRKARATEPEMATA